jgi:hypothetical protein
MAAERPSQSPLTKAVLGELEQLRDQNAALAAETAQLRAELGQLRARVGQYSAILAPAFAPRPEPERRTASSGGTAINWRAYPDHDPCFLAGKATLAEVKAGACECRQRARRAAEAEAEDRRMTGRAAHPCPFCGGSGKRGARPDALGWVPCVHCGAEEFFRMAAGMRGQRGAPETLFIQGEDHVFQPTALDEARQRVRECVQCAQVPAADEHDRPVYCDDGRPVMEGSGKAFPPQQIADCAACRGTGEDTDWAWRQADDAGGQRTLAAPLGEDHQPGLFRQVREHGVVLMEPPPGYWNQEESPP